MNAARIFAVAACLTLAACAGKPAVDGKPLVRHRPAGVVRWANGPEKYLVFESAFAFRGGQELDAMRLGKRIGRVRVHRLQNRPFYAADILEGAPLSGDLLE
jgi:hypothetical protein